MYQLNCIIIISTFLALSGCAFKKKTDPFEGINRGVFLLNKTVDRVLLKPAARIYTAVLPKFAQARINSFFQNLTELPTIANDILQADFCNAATDTSRFIVNSTWGIGGLFDWSEKVGRPRHTNDFGLTLAKWGYKNSVYIVLPFFGPSTLRDTIGRGVTYGMSVWPYLGHLRPKGLAWGLYGLYAVDTRSCYLKLEGSIGDVCVDEYVFMRDAYLQRRAAEMNQGAGNKINASSILLEGPPE